MHKGICNPRDSETQKMNKAGKWTSTPLVYSGLLLRDYRREAEIQKPSKLLYIHEGVMSEDLGYSVLAYKILLLLLLL